MTRGDGTGPDRSFSPGPAPLLHKFRGLHKEILPMKEPLSAKASEEGPCIRQTGAAKGPLCGLKTCSRGRALPAPSLVPADHF